MPTWKEWLQILFAVAVGILGVGETLFACGWLLQGTQASPTVFLVLGIALAVLAKGALSMTVALGFFEGRAVAADSPPGMPTIVPEVVSMPAVSMPAVSMPLCDATVWNSALPDPGNPSSAISLEALAEQVKSLTIEDQAVLAQILNEGIYGVGDELATPVD